MSRASTTPSTSLLMAFLNGSTTMKAVSLPKNGSNETDNHTLNTTLIYTLFVPLIILTVVGKSY